MITERTLKTWRTQALKLKESFEHFPDNSQLMGRATMIAISERILRMTQELLDQHLLRKEKK